MTKKVVVHQIVGHRFLGVNEQGDKVMIDGDQPATGPRPMELLLMALGDRKSTRLNSSTSLSRMPSSA